MSTTTNTTTNTTTRESILLVAAIVDIIEQRGNTITSVDWERRSLTTPGHSGEGVGILIGGRDESAVDDLAEVLRLKPEHPGDRNYGNYRRVGEWAGMVLSVTCGRSRPVCACGSACDHEPVQA